MITKLKAIRSLDPNAHCTLADDVVVTWMTTPISEADIATEQTRLQAEYDSQEYARNRKAEYPSMEDQLDDIYHNGIDGWKATIKTTKDKYPKS
jgi:hypothetical protein